MSGRRLIRPVCEKRAMCTLSHAQSSHRDQMKELKKDHVNLKDNLQHAKQDTFVQSRYKEKELDSLNGRHRRLENVQLFDYQQEIDRLEKQIALERKVHEELAAFLRKRASAKQSEAVEWGSRFETDTQNKERDLDQLKAAHQRDLAKLKEVGRRERPAAGSALSQRPHFRSHPPGGGQVRRGDGAQEEAGRVCRLPAVRQPIPGGGGQGEAREGGRQAPVLLAWIQDPSGGTTQEEAREEPKEEGEEVDGVMCLLTSTSTAPLGF